MKNGPPVTAPDMDNDTGFVIAIDGPSGVGKTTVSKLVAEELNFRYVDTGAMYRAVAVAADAAGVDADDDVALQEFCAGVELEFFDGDSIRADGIRLNGEDLTERIREPGAGPLASLYSSKSVVRELLVAVQRRLGSLGGVVMEGRDIGTVVFPAAAVKIFLDAPAVVRAGRRRGDFVNAGKGGDEVNIKKVERDLVERDERDTSRTDSPLKCAEDAVHVDTGALTCDGVVRRVIEIIREKIGKL